MAHLIRWFTYWKCWFSIAMLNCQKVTGNQSQIKVSSKWSKPLVARAQLLGWPSKVLGGSKILWKPPLNSVGSISPGLALYIFYNIYRVWGHNKKKLKGLGLCWLWSCWGRCCDRLQGHCMKTIPALVWCDVETNFHTHRTGLQSRKPT